MTCDYMISVFVDIHVAFIFIVLTACFGARNMRCRASWKKIGFGRLCGIVSEIFMVPEDIMVPERIESELILMSSGFVTSFIYFWTFSGPRFLLISNLILVIMYDCFCC